MLSVGFRALQPKQIPLAGNKMFSRKQSSWNKIDKWRIFSGEHFVHFTPHWSICRRSRGTPIVSNECFLSSTNNTPPEQTYSFVARRARDG